MCVSNRAIFFKIHVIFKSKHKTIWYLLMNFSFFESQFEQSMAKILTIQISTFQRMIQCVQIFEFDYLNLVIFEVFGVQLWAKKPIFQNCPSDLPYGLFLWGNLTENLTPNTSIITRFRSRTHIFERTVLR